MQQAEYLKKGDVITLISTARKITAAELQPTIALIEEWGLHVKLSKHIFESHHQFAGTREQRINAIQTAINDQESKAILCARGGYGTVQLIDAIDFSDFIKRPQWIVGYSDVTVLHNHINQNFGLETLHATMPINFPKQGENEATTSLRRALFGEHICYSFEWEEGSVFPSEAISAPLVGGNLSILYSLCGSSSQLNTASKWLFIEDLDEYLYHIDRMMMNLRRNGLLNGIKGLLVGGMSDMNDNAIPYGQTAKEIILQHAKEVRVPVVFGIPSGHLERNLALIFNREVRLSVQGKKAELIFHGRS